MYVYINLYTHTYTHIRKVPQARHTQKTTLTRPESPLYIYIYIYIYVHTHIHIHTHTHTHKAPQARHTQKTTLSRPESPAADQTRRCYSHWMKCLRMWVLDIRLGVRLPSTYRRRNCS